MRKTFDLIASWKRIDIVFQCIMFVVMILAIVYSELWLFGMYIMGLAQLLSSIIWLIFSGVNGLSMSSDSVLIRWFVIVTFIILLGTVTFNIADFITVSCYMVIIGPIIGVIYFLITVAEAKYFSNARKPYYLL